MVEGCLGGSKYSRCFLDIYPVRRSLSSVAEMRTAACG